MIAHRSRGLIAILVLATSLQTSCNKGEPLPPPGTMPPPTVPETPLGSSQPGTTEGKLVASESLQVSLGGYCSLDVINKQPLATMELKKGDAIYAGGWVVSAEMVVPGIVEFLLSNAAATYAMEFSPGASREDVASVLHDPRVEMAGFNLIAHTHGVPAGKYDTSLRFANGDICLLNKKIIFD